MEDIKFKDSLTFWQDLFKEQKSLFYFFLIFVLISFFSFIWFLSSGSLVFAMFTIGFIIFALFSLAAFLVNHFAARNNVVLKDNNFTIPAFDFGNQALRAISEDGYFYDTKYNDFSLLSSYSNIKRIWRVSDEKEKQALDINKNWFNAKIFANTSILSVDIKNIINIIKNWKENDKIYDNLIKKCFIHRYVTDSNKVIGIEFKELKFRYPKMLAWEEKVSAINSVKDTLYNDFKDVIVYVSVAEPEKLIEELKTRINKK